MLSRRYKYHIRRIITIASPIIAGHLGHIVHGIADTAMVGQLGETPLAAVALANNSFILFFVFAFGISLGITPLVASNDGTEGDRNYVWLRQGLIVNLLTGLIMFLLTLLFAPLLYHLNQPMDVVEIAIPYLSIIAFSNLPLMFFQHYKQFAEGLSFTKIAMVISVFSNLLNVGLNYVLIFGKLGFPRLELIGAGWATFSARCIMGILMFWYVYKSAPFQKYWKQVQSYKPHWKSIREILQIGIPTGLQYVVEIGAFVFAAIMIGWLGAQELAAHQIALSLSAVTYMIASGLSAASTVRIGNYFGRTDKRNLKMAGQTSFWLTACMMGIFALTLIYSKELLPPLFTPVRAVQEIAVPLIMIAAIYQLSDGLQVVGLGVLRGMKDVRIPTLATILAYWGLGIPVGYILGFTFKMGVTGIWYGLSLGLTIAAVFHIWRFNYLTKKAIA